jgi:hypothetical protein
MPPGPQNNKVNLRRPPAVRYVVENANRGPDNFNALFGPLFGVPMAPGPTAIPNLRLTAPPPARKNVRVSTETAAINRLADSEHSDTEAVLRHAFEQAPLDPEVARRVDERAARITEQVRRTHGVIDDETFQLLLADDES